MSQFTLLTKRPSAGQSTSAINGLPAICILEQQEDGLMYLWPLERTFSRSVVLDPADATDRMLLHTGEFITYGGYYYSVTDYLSRNNLPQDQLYRMHIGEFQDISEARDMLKTLKSLL